MAMGCTTSGSAVTTCALNPGGSFIFAAVSAGESDGSVATGLPLSSSGDAAKAVTDMVVKRMKFRMCGS